MDIEQRVMVLIASKAPDYIYLGSEELKQLKQEAQSWRWKIESENDLPVRLLFSSVEIVEVNRKNYIKAHKE